MIIISKVYIIYSLLRKCVKMKRLENITYIFFIILYIVRYYCPYKGCEGINFKLGAAIYRHIRGKHLPTFYIIRKQDSTFETSSGHEIRFDDGKKKCSIIWIFIL